MNTRTSAITNNTKAIVNTHTTLRAVISATLFTTLIITQSAGAYAQPLRESEITKKQKIEKAAVVTSTATFGALAGGPLGFAVGLISGAFINDFSSKQDAKKLAREESILTINDLETTVIAQEIKVEKLEKIAHQKLQLKIQFDTGSDTLTTSDEKNLATLSEVLHDDSTLNVRLDGYTDPRGTDEYNNVLSLERAKSVAAILEDYGINPERIDINGHGSKHVPNLLSATDYTEYRRVDIETYTPEEKVNRNDGFTHVAVFD